LKLSVVITGHNYYLLPFSVLPGFTVPLHVVNTKKVIQENVKKALDARSCLFKKWKKNPSMHAERGGRM
jgi:hypothetical protein